jgi:membrane protease YdiL (CAAX protease family)
VLPLVFFPIWYALTPAAPADLYTALRRAAYSPWGVTFGSAVMQAAACLTVRWRAKRDRSVRVGEQLGLGPSRVGVWAWPLFYFASVTVGYAGALLTWAGQAAGLLPTKAPFFERDLKALSGASAGESLAIALLLGIAAGIGEEVVIRGYLQRRLMRRWPPLRSILAGALLFAGFHLDMAHIVAIVPVGMWFGYVSWRADSIRPTIAVHLCIDLLYFVLALLPRELTESLRNPALLGALGIVAILSVPASILILEASARRHRAAVQ